MTNHCKVKNYYIRPEGLDYPTSPVAVRYAESNGWHLDLLEDGRWLVSQGELRVGIFREIGEASGYYVGKSHIEKAHFGPLVAEAERQPQLYKTLLVLERTLDEEITALLERGEYWRSEDRQEMRMDASWRIAREFIYAVKFNRQALAQEGLIDPVRAIREAFLAAEGKIEELAELRYCESASLAVGQITKG